jgi:hypothetical protein
MVSRQPSVAIAFTNSMPQPNKFRNLVSRYLNGNKSRRKRLTREFVPVREMSPPPPPPPKDISYYEFTGCDDVDAGAFSECVLVDIATNPTIYSHEICTTV